MARFNPDTYPDRLAFEAHARRLRSAEIDRLLATAVGSLAAARDQWIPALARSVAAGAALARRHSHF